MNVQLKNKVKIQMYVCVHLCVCKSGKAIILTVAQMLFGMEICLEGIKNSL